MGQLNKYLAHGEIIEGPFSFTSQKGQGVKFGFLVGWPYFPQGKKEEPLVRYENIRLSVYAFGSIAEVIKKEYRKGDYLTIEGRLSYVNFEDNQGKIAPRLYVILECVYPAPRYKSYGERKEALRNKMRQP